MTVLAGFLCLGSLGRNRSVETLRGVRLPGDNRTLPDGSESHRHSMTVTVVAVRAAVSSAGRLAVFPAAGRLAAGGSDDKYSSHQQSGGVQVS